ncbi:MAG TPA: two-component system response regulator, partial [Saprospirales bacterium]|nr:two-component system response regulator [Saprospirales bacterium]
SIQKSEANASFFKYVSKNYLSWLDDQSKGPLMSHQLMKKAVLPKMESGIPTFFIL